MKSKRHIPFKCKIALAIFFFNPIMITIYLIVFFISIVVIVDLFFSLNISHFDIKIDEFDDGYFADSEVSLCENLLPYKDFYKDYNCSNIEYHYYSKGGKTLHMLFDSYEYVGLSLTYSETEYLNAKMCVEEYNQTCSLFSYGDYVFYDKYYPEFTNYTSNEIISIRWINILGFSDETNTIFFGGVYYYGTKNEKLVIDDWSYLCENVFVDFSFD